ncbi:MAG: L,D-transpeptidase, partial [Krumholzibacteria bacterium]|nr:L,D-transpeptidase [Candidatus Krumholzibacteria bacterium]
RDAALPAAARFADPAQVRTWRKWVDATVARSAREKIPAIVVYKEKRLLVLYDRGRAVAVYTADMGRNRLQQKRHAGDKATPEGRYHVTAKKQGGQTRYYKALLLDYPNDEDRSRFARIRAEGGVPDGVGPGRHIEIHGHGGRERDWTDGCVALSDPDMDTLFAKVAVGTPVTIVGGDGQDGVFSSLWRDHAAENGR